MVAGRHGDGGLLATCCGACPPTPNAAPPTPSADRSGRRSLAAVRFALQAVHGAAVFDLGDRADGLAELQQARSDFGDNQTGAEHCAAMAMLEFRAALLLGHAAAARTVLGWLTERTGDNAELVVMRAWADAAAGHHEHARAVIRAVLDGSTPALLPHTVVEALAAGDLDRRHREASGPPPATPCKPLWPSPNPSTRCARSHRPGRTSASCWCTSAAASAHRRSSRTGCSPWVRVNSGQTAMLSEREITVLGLLPSMLSLEEIALDLTVSVNTVKSHVRSIYTKLGVSSRRLAVLAAHERGPPQQQRALTRPRIGRLRRSGRSRAARSAAPRFRRRRRARLLGRCLQQRIGPSCARMHFDEKGLHQERGRNGQDRSDRGRAAAPRTPARGTSPSPTTRRRRR